MTEILVVLAVVALLASIAIPSYHRMQAVARAKSCAGNLRQIGIALNLYMADSGLVFPELVPARSSKDEDLPAIDTVLLPYMTDTEPFRCPADHEGLWETTGTSYFWNSTVNGQHAGNMNFLNLTSNQVGIPLAADKENFHENVGQEVNILYADGHVDKELRFTVDK